MKVVSQHAYEMRALCFVRASERAHARRHAQTNKTHVHTHRQTATKERAHIDDTRDDDQNAFELVVLTCSEIEPRRDDR